jgi:hypothetical protein
MPCLCIRPGWSNAKLGIFSFRCHCLKSLTGRPPSKGFSVFFKLDGRHAIERPMRAKVIVLVLKHLGYGADLVHA